MAKELRYLRTVRVTAVVWRGPPARTEILLPYPLSTGQASPPLPRVSPWQAVVFLVNSRSPPCRASAPGRRTGPLSERPSPSPRRTLFYLGYKVILPSSLSLVRPLAWVHLHLPSSGGSSRSRREGRCLSRPASPPTSTDPHPHRLRLSPAAKGPIDPRSVCHRASSPGLSAGEVRSPFCYSWQHPRCRGGPDRAGRARSASVDPGRTGVRASPEAPCPYRHATLPRSRGPLPAPRDRGDRPPPEASGLESSSPFSAPRD